MIGPSFAAMVASATCALPLTAACGDAAPAAPAAPPATVLRARVEIDTGEGRVTGLIAFDLDGNGRDELIGLQRGPGALRVWSGLSNRVGTPLTGAFHEVGDYALGPVRVGEWKPRSDGGLAVVAIAQREEPALVLVDVRAMFLGTVEPVVGRLELASRPRALASGDLGRDGRPEVVVVTLDDEMLVVRDGAIVARHQLADEQTTCVHVADDGASILVGSQATRRITRYTADAKGKFSAAGSVTLDGLPRDIDEIDGWRGASGARWLVAAGDGEIAWIAAAKDGALAIERTESVAAVPIDLVHAGAAPKRARLAVSVHGQALSLEREDGGAAWTTYAGQHPNAGALGDFDGDGSLDVALANGDAKRVGVLFGRAQGGFDVARFAKTGRSPHSIDTGDFDGDGRLDVVALCALEGSVEVLRGTADGLSDAVSQGYAESAHHARARDLDGDGKLDVAFVRDTDRGVVLDAWFGDGTGRLWMRGELKPAACATSLGDLLVADVDQDGTLEAIVTDPAASRVVVVPIDRPRPGAAEFGAPRAFDVAGAPRELALVASGAGAGTVAATLSGAAPRRGWCTLRVSRTEVVETLHQPMSEPPRAIAVAPGTAALAYVGGDEGAAILSVFERDTAGKGLTLSGQARTGLRAYALRCADLDGDGRADFVVSSQNSHQLNVWLGRGAGATPPLTRLFDVGVGTGPLDVLVVDLDGDGDLEIVSACAFSDQIAVVELR